jgi:type IV pilus assembly protein PilQ
VKARSRRGRRALTVAALLARCLLQADGPPDQAAAARPDGALIRGPAEAADNQESAGAGAGEPAPRAGQPRRLISLDFKDADVVNIVRILAAESGRNIVAGDDVRGKISIALRNVSWEQALDAVLAAKGLEKVERDGVIRIVSQEQREKERETRARAEEAQRKAEAEIRAKAAEAHAREIEARAREQEALRRRQQAEEDARQMAARGPLTEATIRLYYADAEEVARTLQGLLGIVPEDAPRIKGAAAGGPPVIPEPPFSALFGPPPAPPPPTPVPPEVLEKRLTIRAYRPTNTLFLRLYRSDIEQIRTLIRESIDIPVPQVKIEARMEILDRSALEQIGIQWGGFVARNAGSQTLVGQGFSAADLLRGGTPVQGLNPPNSAFTLSQGLPVSSLTGLPLGGNVVNLPISTLPTQGPLPTTGIAFGIIGTNLNVNLALQALAEQGKTRTLARPEIVTVENNLASIELGEEIPYTTVSSAGTQIQFKKAALRLDVTPTVVKEGDHSKIRMSVMVENNSRGDVVNLGAAGTPPAINTRKAVTQVLIREGERLVIGGIARTEMRDNIRKVPLLGDIPILGALFRISETFEQGRELVVFLTPRVLRAQPATAGTPPVTAPPPPVTAPPPPDIAPSLPGAAPPPPGPR